MAKLSRHALDDTDLRILDVLQREGRITNAELASRINLSPAPCLRRLQRLEREHVITGYGARVDPERVGLGLQAFVRIQLEKHDTRTIERFSQRVARLNEVVACFALTGDLDYLLHVHVAGLDDFARFLNKVLAAGVVADVNSSFVLNVVKQGHGLPIPRRAAATDGP